MDYMLIVCYLLQLLDNCAIKPISVLSVVFNQRTVKCGALTHGIYYGPMFVGMKCVHVHHPLFNTGCRLTHCKLPLATHLK